MKGEECDPVLLELLVPEGKLPVSSAKSGTLRVQTPRARDHWGSSPECSKHPKTPTNLRVWIAVTSILWNVLVIHSRPITIKNW